jgi:hypothetical protein
MTMHRQLARTAALFALVAFQARGDTLANLTIQGVVAAEGGIYIEFSPAPAACSGGTYLAGHGFIPRSVARFEELYAFAMETKLLGQQVTITFTDRGNCDHAETTLLVTEIR